MYKNFRCGLYHNGLPGEKIFLMQSQYPIKARIDAKNEIIRIEIDTNQFLKSIEHHSFMYINELRNPKNIERRAKFEKAFKLIYR